MKMLILNKVKYIHLSIKKQIVESDYKWWHIWTSLWIRLSVWKDKDTLEIKRILQKFVDGN